MATFASPASLTRLGASSSCFKSHKTKSERLFEPRRSAMVPHATFNTSFPLPSEDPSPLHGVLHSTSLPRILADSVGPYDARDAIEACAGLWGDEKEECYAIFGVDPAADIWVDVVFSLEHALELETEPEEEAFHHGQERC